MKSWRQRRLDKKVALYTSRPTDPEEQAWVNGLVAKGLDEDQQVVTDGQSRLQQGTRVAVNDGTGKAVTAANTGG